MTKITWENKQMRLGDLIEWEKNPKQISSENARRLRQSLKKFGQVAPLAVGPGGELYDGHQRKRVWSLADEYGPELMVDVRVSSRALTDDEQKELTVLLYKGATGETDFDRLSSFFEVDDLLEWGFEERELGLGAMMDFVPFEGEGDGGGSIVANGQTLRVVLGPHMFDLRGEVAGAYPRLGEIDEETVRDAVVELVQGLV